MVHCSILTRRLGLVRRWAKDYHGETVFQSPNKPFMSGISSVSGSQTALPYGGQQVRLRASQRAAEQAEQTAQTLRQRADEAQQDADRSQEAARGLGAQANQAESYASQVRRGTPVLEAKPVPGVPAAGKVVANTVAAPRQANAADAPTATGNTGLPGVVNLRGQKLGQFINVAV